LNTSTKIINIRSIKSLGRLILCGKFNVEKIHSKGRVTFVGADVAEKGGKARGKLFAYSAKFEEASNSWTIVETGKLNGKIESYGLTGGLFTLGTKLADKTEHFSESHGGFGLGESKSDRIKEVKQDKNNKPKLVESGDDDRRPANNSEKAEMELTKVDKVNQSKQEPPSENGRRLKATAVGEPVETESVLDKVSRAANDLVDKGSKVVKTLVSSSEEDKSNKNPEANQSAFTGPETSVKANGKKGKNK
jgi:hypothetical protein